MAFSMKALALLVIVAGIDAHVRMMQPPSRSSLWRDTSFEDQNPPINYDDDALYCGRVHQEVVVTNCGVCGDPAADPAPRANENGGTFGQGIIAANYSAGQEIDITLDFTTTHLGYFEIHLCEGLQETEECFYKNFLTFPDGSTKVQVEENGAVVTKITKARLPQGVTCDRCVLRMNYRAGNNWGDCEDGTGGMGCGLQETFRHCADISIH